jgi:hypothetical protein
LEHHPHVHALVPGAGPGLDGGTWQVARHPKHRRRQKPYLTDNVALGRAFRDAYLHELRRMFSRGRLKIGGSVAFLNDDQQRESWLKQLEAIDWNVFIQGPPRGKSDPEDVVKYLAGYLTGGPIADKRVISADQDEVWFMARPKQSAKKRRGMNVSRPYRLSGRQFMQRWCLHILPKGFTRSRFFGGYHGSKRQGYLAQCRELLPAQPPESSAPPPTAQLLQDQDKPQHPCPHCNGEMTLIHSQPRPSWRQVFEIDVYRTSEYSPVHHIAAARAPPQETSSTRST